MFFFVKLNHINDVWLHNPEAASHWISEKKRWISNLSLHKINQLCILTQTVCDQFPEWVHKSQMTNNCEFSKNQANYKASPVLTGQITSTRPPFFFFQPRWKAPKLRGFQAISGLLLSVSVCACGGEVKGLALRAKPSSREPTLGRKESTWQGHGTHSGCMGAIYHGWQVHLSVPFGFITCTFLST